MASDAEGSLHVKVAPHCRGSPPSQAGVEGSLEPGGDKEAIGAAVWGRARTVVVE